MDLNRTERLLDSGAFELNLKDQSVVCSKGFLQLLNLNSATDLSNWSDVLQFVHKDHVKHIQFLLQLLKEKGSNFHEVLSWVTASKEIISLRTMGEFVEGAEGGKLIFAVQKDRIADFDLKRNLLLQSVIERANDGVLITEAEPSGPEGRKILYANPAFTKLTGYELEEIVGKTPKILQGPRTDEEAIKKMSRALKKWDPCELSLINYRKNGKEFWMKLSITPVADDKGWYTHWVAIERDATNLVLRDFKNKFLSEISMIFGQSASSTIAMQQMTEKVLEFGDFSMAEVWVPNRETKKLYLVSYSYKDDAGEYFYVDNSSVDEFAYGVGLPGLVWQNLDYVFMEDLEQCHSFERKFSEESADLKFGHGIPLVANGDFQGVLLVCAKSDKQSISNRVDLLNQMSGELALEIKRKNAEDDYNQLFINAPDLICTCGFDGVFRRVNAAGENILGYSKRTLLSEPFIDFVHPEDKAATEREFLRLTTGHSTIKFENRYLDPNGKTKWLSWSATSFPEQRVIHAVAKDITDHKMVEQLLQEATSMARVGSWEYDLIDEAVYWSPMTAEIHGEPADFKPEIEKLINYFKKEDRDFVVEKLRRCMEFGQTFDFEAPIVTKKKEEVWIRIIGKAEFINGQCVSIYGSFQDINQRKQTELRLNHIADNLPGVIFQYELSPNGSDWMNYVSKGSYDIWGLSPEECMEDMGKIWEQVEAGGSMDELRETIRESLQTMSQWNSTARIKNAVGEFIWLEGLGIPRKRQNGNIIWDSIVLNVTEKIELSDSLRRAGRMSKVGSWEVKIIDKQATQVFLSSISCEIFEVEPYHEYNLSALIEFFEAESKEPILECIQQLIEGRGAFDSEFLIQTKEGQKKWVRCIGESDLDETDYGRIYGSIQDIHIRKTAELELEKTLKEKNMLLESIGDGFFSVNKQWEVTYWNRQAEDILERKRTAIIGENLWKSIPEAELSNFQDLLHEAMESDKAVYFEDYFVGMSLWIEVSAYPSEHGLSVFLKDISGRKKAEAEIKLSNERFLKVTEATHDAIWDWDIVEDLIYRSVGFQNLFGYQHDAPEQDLKSWMKKIHPEDFPNVKKQLEETLADSDSINFSAEYRFLKFDGDYAHVMDRGVIIRETSGKPIRIVGSMSDITDRIRRIRAIQSQNEKLKQIAWTQSHVVRAPLARLMGLVMEVQREGLSEEERNELMDHILKSSEELDEIIRDIVENSKIVLNLDNQ